MSAHRGTPNGTHSIEPLSTDIWRVSDLRFSENDPRRLLGFVELKGEEFEAMSLGRRFSWSRFGTLEEAAAHLAADSSDAPTPEEHVLSWMLTNA
ncbi:MULTISPECIES: hypothetical protein [unclassified Cryobacterium]|uniref:hypothetical protein n=1 Tax=unclassified Cryobacterium TaxID=2649013 RepID=UPI001447AE7D|nr:MULTISPECIES: hypothetical protein [unclassified Cryobacterium]